MANEKTETKIDETAELRAQVAALGKQVNALLSSQQSAGGITAEQLEAVMTRLVTVQSDAHAAAMKEIAERDHRDDVNYPRVSVYSYPEGDRKKPRPLFKCRMLWLGYELDWDTTTAAELEMLNAIEPGEYTFRRIGGAPEKLTVEGERNGSGVLSKLSFLFPTKEHRDTLPSMAWMLRDALGVKTSEQLEIDRLTAEVLKLRTAQAVA
jgi:hypothetical protein